MFCVFDGFINNWNVSCRSNMSGENRICIYVHTYDYSYRRPGIVKKHYRCDNTCD